LAETYKETMKLFHVALLCSIACMTSCTSTTSSKSTSSTPVLTTESKVDVYLMPMDDFNFQEAALLSRVLSRELGIQVKATLNVGSSGLSPFPNTTQFAAEDIEEIARRAIRNLPDIRPDSAFIILTQRDINTKDRTLKFNFSVHNKSTRTAVISSARLVLNQSGGKADLQTIRKRLAKMVKRNIGDVYFGYTRSTDIRDVMYSPIMSLDDVDKMGSDFISAKSKH
jgi:predicted Zn-dependent protease